MYCPAFPGAAASHVCFHLSDVCPSPLSCLKTERNHWASVWSHTPSSSTGCRSVWKQKVVSTNHWALAWSHTPVTVRRRIQNYLETDSTDHWFGHTHTPTMETKRSNMNKHTIVAHILWSSYDMLLYIAMQFGLVLTHITSLPSAIVHI